MSKEDAKSADTWAIGALGGLHLVSAAPALTTFSTGLLTALSTVSITSIPPLFLALLTPGTAPAVTLLAAYVALAVAAARGEEWRTPLQLCVGAIEVWGVLSR